MHRYARVSETVINWLCMPSSAALNCCFISVYNVFNCVAYLNSSSSSSSPSSPTDCVVTWTHHKRGWTQPVFNSGEPLYLCLRWFTECPFNCRTCINSEKDVMICQTCNYQYVLNAGDCGACPRHCLKCTESSDGLTCTQCKNRTVMMSGGTCERKYSLRFLMWVSHIAQVIAIGWTSVRPLRLSVTRWYCVETAKPIVKLSSLPGSPWF